MEILNIMRNGRLIRKYMKQSVEKESSDKIMEGFSNKKL